MKRAVLICLTLLFISCRKPYIADGHVYFRKGVPAPNIDIKFIWGLNGSSATNDLEVIVTSDADGQFAMKKSTRRSMKLTFITVDCDSGRIYMGAPEDLSDLELIIRK